MFLDTPGIHKPKSKLGEHLVQTARAALEEVDLILLLVDAEEGMGPGDRFIIEHLKQVETPVFLVVNKYPPCASRRPASADRFLIAASIPSRKWFPFPRCRGTTRAPSWI